MDIGKLLIKDTDGNKSLTASIFLSGSVVVFLKLIFAGITIGSITLAPFDGGDFAAAMGALGAIYVMRRSTDPLAKERRSSQESKNGEA